MADNKPTNGGCFLAFILFVIDQAIAFTAMYFTAEGAWAALEKQQWITDPDGVGLIGAFIGLAAYGVITIIGHSWIKRWTGVEVNEYIPFIP